jgi:hypothetical protein
LVTRKTEILPGPCESATLPAASGVIANPS